MSDDLMDELLNNINFLDLSSYNNEEKNKEINNSSYDWDLITRNKKGTDKTNNSNIVLLENLKLDHKIYNTSLELYNKTLENNKFKRMKFKNALMCSCVFLAFSYHEDYREENALMEYFKIDKKKYTKGLKMVKTSINDVRYIINSFDNLLFTVARNMDILEDVKYIKSFVELNKNYVLFNTKRISINSVYYSLIYIWMLKNKKIIPNINSYSCVCNTSKKSLFYVLVKNKKLLEEFVLKKTIELSKKFIESLEKQHRKSSLILLPEIPTLEKIFIMKKFFHQINNAN